MNQIPTSPSAGYTFILRANIANRPGTLGRLATAIGRAGASIGSVDLVEHRGSVLVRDVAILCRDEAHAKRVVGAARRVRGVEIRSVWDRTFELHRGGKICVTPRVPLRSRDDLSMAYTPGVARISGAIADHPERVWELTGKGNAVAVLTDGSAVLGLGNIGPEAALPVMEGKAVLFKEFADIDAYPICVRAEGPDDLVRVAKAIAPGFARALASLVEEAELSEEYIVPSVFDRRVAPAVAAAVCDVVRTAGSGEGGPDVPAGDPLWAVGREREG